MKAFLFFCQWKLPAENREEKVMRAQDKTVWQDKIPKRMGRERRIYPNRSVSICAVVCMPHRGKSTGTCHGRLLRHPVPCVGENRGLIDHLLHGGISRQPFSAHRDSRWFRRAKKKKRVKETGYTEVERRRKTRRCERGKMLKTKRGGGSEMRELLGSERQEIKMEKRQTAELFYRHLN